MVEKIFYEMFLYGLERFGLYYSSYRAIVHDNVDVDGYNRLQLIVPQFDKKIPYANWAWPKGNFSGKDYGINLLPQKGDLVWVEFEHGNRNKPIWSFGYFTKDEKPKEFDSPNTYGLKTPYGFSILIKDNDKAITITTPNNLSLEFNDIDGTVVIRNDKGNIYQFGEDNILQDAGGDAIIHQRDGKIYLGKEATHPGTLGDKTEDRINELISIVEDLTDGIDKHLIKDSVPLAAVGATGAGTFLAKIPGIKLKITELKPKIKELKSTVINLQ